MGHGTGQSPPAGVPGQPGPPGDGSDKGGGDQPPPIPVAPDGPGRSYGTAPGPAYGGYGGHAGQPPPPAYGAPSPGYASGGYDAYGAYGGTGAYAPHGYGWQGPPLPAGRSIAAMVVGIVSVVLVVTCWGSFASVLSSTVALVLGASARRGVARGELGGRPQATAGFVLGIVGLALSVIVSTLLVLSLTAWADDSGGGGSGGGGGDGDSYDARGAGASVTLTYDG